MAKTFLLSFDPHKTDADALHKVISTSPYVTNWSHYLASSYVLRSNHNLTTIMDDIIARWPKQRFLLTEIKHRERNGWMPMKAWDWFKKFDDK